MSWAFAATGSGVSEPQGRYLLIRLLQPRSWPCQFRPVRQDRVLRQRRLWLSQQRPARRHDHGQSAICAGRRTARQQGAVACALTRRRTRAANEGRSTDGAACWWRSCSTSHRAPVRGRFAPPRRPAARAAGQRHRRTISTPPIRPRIDADLAISLRPLHRFDPADYIPASPVTIASITATIGEATGWFGSARFRYLGPRPLIEDGSAWWSGRMRVVNARVGYRFDNGIRVQLDALNLFNSNDHQIDYFYASRLPRPAGRRRQRHSLPSGRTASVRRRGGQDLTDRPAFTRGRSRRL